MIMIVSISVLYYGLIDISCTNLKLVLYFSVYQRTVLWFNRHFLYSVY